MAQPGKMIDLIKGKAGDMASSAFRKVVGETANAQTSGFVTDKDWDFEPTYPRFAYTKGGSAVFILDSEGHEIYMNPSSANLNPNPTPTTNEILKVLKRDGTYLKNLTVAYPKKDWGDRDKLHKAFEAVNNFAVQSGQQMRPSTKAEYIYNVVLDENDKEIKDDPKLAPTPMKNGQNKTFKWMNSFL